MEIDNNTVAFEFWMLDIFKAQAVKKMKAEVVRLHKKAEAVLNSPRNEGQATYANKRDNLLHRARVLVNAIEELETLNTSATK